MSDAAPRLIVGLGNPDEKYEQTRHNAGFLALDFFAAQHGPVTWTEKMKGLYCSLRCSGAKVLLLKPQTYMNRSGESVLAYVKYFDIDCRNILVVHDDLDLECGRLKMVAGGGAGGHNGIRSLVELLGRDDFARLKIGIGHPRNREETASIPVERFVLSRFAAEEWKVLQDMEKLIAKGIELFVAEGISTAMNRINCAAKAGSSSGPRCDGSVQ